MVGSQPVVAIGEEFLTSFSKLPKSQQKKVRTFIEEFKANPKSPGINYEKLKHTKDPNLRSVRIDKAYRGIVLSPPGGDVHVLLWVAHHDDAYKWAENKMVCIHPETGGLQVLNVEHEVVTEKTEAAPEPGLFDSFAEADLTKLGVPEMMVPLARSLKSDDDLDRYAAEFPQEAAEALYMLASGYTLDEVARDMGKDSHPDVDTGDFVSALWNPDSMRRFQVVQDEKELLAMLDEPLEKWRVFLHPSQRKLVENDWKGPVRVLGGAGTGKTVVAMHRAKHLATQVFTDKVDRILFTTFTRNLAEDIRENLSRICPQDAMRRIEVVNLDRWVSDFLHRRGYEYKIDFGAKTAKHWRTALTMAPTDQDLPDAFYREEWDQVIQPQSVNTEDDYIRASRIGRGTRLNRKARKAIWPVFEEYRSLLSQNNLKEGIDAMRDARIILENEGDILPYKAVVVDEAQDMGTQAFKLIRRLVPTPTDKKLQIFIVGDAHQRIYKYKVILSQCGIDILGRGRKLRLNYRTTEQTRRWAVSILEGQTVDDLDGGTDDHKGYRSLMHGIEPKIEHFETFDQEVASIIDYLRKLLVSDGYLNTTCLVTRTKALLDQYESALEQAGIPHFRVRRTEPDDRNEKGVRLATMHRVKGLEFDRVILAAINDGVVPLSAAVDSGADEVAKREGELHERSLLYVAATRAKREVFITSFGNASGLISGYLKN